MKLGINTSCFSGIADLDTRFAMIADSGFDCVDLDLTFMYPWSSICNGLDSHWLKMSDQEMLKEIQPYKSALHKYGLICGQAHALDPTYMPDPVLYEKLLYLTQRQIMLCDYLECPYLIIHPAHHLFYEQYLPIEEEWDLNINMFSHLLPWLKRYNVIACLENMYTEHNGKPYAAICQHPKEICHYVDSLNEIAGEKRFAFCLDTGHAMFAGLELRNMIRQLGERLVALHLNDNNGMQDQHLIPYMGRVDWNRLIDGLREIRYSNTLSFEILLSNIDFSLYPECLKLVAAIGQLIRNRIETQNMEV